MTAKVAPRTVDAKLSRRQFLTQLACLAPLLLLQTSCERHRYIRPPGELDLGPVKELLYNRYHNRSKAVLVFRDIDGWYALSTRCTYRGCDLTYQEPVLLCPCCRTRYRLDGIPFEGWPATRPLPWIDVYYRDGHLYANPGTLRAPNWRFTTPEIEEAIRKLKKQSTKAESLDDEVEIPKILGGKGDGSQGVMFLEEDPNMVHEIDMIK